MPVVSMNILINWESPALIDREKKRRKPEFMIKNNKTRKGKNPKYFSGNTYLKSTIPATNNKTVSMKRPTIILMDRFPILLFFWLNKVL
jgi:hypothetical protein